MKTNDIRRGVLKVLLACDGVPMPEPALLSAVVEFVRPRPTGNDVLAVISDLEGRGFIAGLSDELTSERTWTLTDKGTHRAREL